MKRVILAASKLSVKGFFKFFDKSVDKSVQQNAAKILYKWYSAEGEEFMPDADDILDMCDAATNTKERNIVLEALGYEPEEDDDEEDW